MDLEQIILETLKNHDKALTIREIADETGETQDKVTMTILKLFSDINNW